MTQGSKAFALIISTGVNNLLPLGRDVLYNIVGVAHKHKVFHLRWLLEGEPSRILVRVLAELPCFAFAACLAYLFALADKIDDGSSYESILKFYTEKCGPKRPAPAPVDSLRWISLCVALWPHLLYSN